MTNYFFKRTIAISLLGHITLFSLFSFSFGPKIPEGNFTDISFRGAILRVSDLTDNRNFRPSYNTVTIKRPEALILDKIDRESFLDVREYIKPAAILPIAEDRIVFAKKLNPRLPPAAIKEPTIIFYPKLPYNFSLYFKDRQIAHIELEFQVISTGRKSSILIKRKISSGNLEADLLSLRYINHYLSIEQAAFPPDKWQTVKIDLSALND
ncbi:MAG: hypothetical protein V1884_01020 [Candidatus Omnitrophota bacterium]